MSAVHPQQRDDERLFAEKARKFDDAVASFRNLSDSLTEFKDAVLCAAECGVKVAAVMETFFAVHDRPHKEVASKFVEAQGVIRTKWRSDAEKVFDSEVLGPIESWMGEIPAVRRLIKLRANTLSDMQKKQKRLKMERKRDGTRFRDKQRKYKDISDQYTMFTDEVFKRFNYVERNLGTFIVPPMRSLLTLLSDVSRVSFESLDKVVKLVSETPSITRDISSAPSNKIYDLASAGVETWNDFGSDQNDSDSGNGSDEHQTDDAETDLISMNAGSSEVYRRLNPRIHSAEAHSRGPAASIAGLELTNEMSLMTSPRRGRSASSAPAESWPILSGTSPPPFQISPGTASRDGGVGPGSSSGRASQLGDYQAMNALNGTSAASSTSTDNLTDRVTANSQLSMDARRRRDVGRKSSVDTLNSTESVGRPEVKMRLVALYDFSPRESNELELMVGNVIEVIAKNESGWWCGQCGRSKGYFPRNYTRPLTEKEELEYLAEKERRRRQRGHQRHESVSSRKSASSTGHNGSSVPAL